MYNNIFNTFFLFRLSTYINSTIAKFELIMNAEYVRRTLIQKTQQVIVTQNQMLRDIFFENPSNSNIMYEQL